MSWGFQGIISSVANFLGVPIGATYRPSSSKEPKETGVKLNDLVKSIIEITVDDVCVGATPFYYRCSDDATLGSRAKFDKILRELNSISKWIAFDLLAVGFSAYKIVIKGRDVFFYPILEPVRIVLNSKKEVVVYDEEEHKISDTLVFVNYNKQSLKPIEGKNYEYEITPKAIQLSNVQDTLKELELIEKALLRYRRDLSKIIRFISVEVGVAQGAKQQEVVDNISSGINANSLAFETDVNDMFDDEIPVFPTRKGLGKPEYEEHIPNANLSDLADLDHVLGKLYLGMRIPKSYVSFDEALGANVASTIRGDIRYSRMLKACRTLIINTVNSFFRGMSSAVRYDLEYRMQEIPNPEDQEVIESLQGYSDFIKDATDNIINDSETYAEAYFKLLSYQYLLGDSSNLRSIERWFALVKRYMKLKFKNEEEPIDLANEDEDGDSIPDDEDNLEPIDEAEGPSIEESTEPEENTEPEEGGEEEPMGEYAPNEVPPQFP